MLKFSEILCCILLAIFGALVGSFAGIGIREVIDRKTTTAGKISYSVYKAIDNEEDKKVIKLDNYSVIIERVNQ